MVRVEHDPRDNIFDVTPGYRGEDLADYIPFPKESPSTNKRYLALAAGGAAGEMGFAKALGVDDANITLVDKQFPEGESFPQVKMVQEDIFSFLQRPTTLKYDYVTAFGIEYVLSPDSLQRLLSDLAFHLNPGACVVIFPYDQTSVGNALYETGPLNNDSQHARPMYYRFKVQPNVAPI